MRDSMIFVGPRFGIWNGWAFLDRLQNSWSDTRRIASMSGTMSRVSAIWMWPERRWNATQWNVSTQLRNQPRIPTPIRKHFVRYGQSLGKVEPILSSSYAQNSGNVLEINDEPLAHEHRATVS